ncbi:hypothetical protein [Chryseobacterium hagamense]|uniref:Uncharacterized protein n=1 Tax=Chryseobacterium hagamense TaxID=395935 RepID=A0A511YLX0_9FLAO|nr:hypothetical protein [Chryseobacterium hagamense]GEN76204.1 hypothetical protein CHA01nite_19440 [Chryseobacterium hagamense]
MKKTILALLALSGASTFAQSSIFVMNNMNPHFDAVGRFFTSRPTAGSPLVMFAAPNANYGTFTMPSGIYHKYGSFDTTGGTGSIMDITQWYVSDYVNPANSGTYNYNDPFITSFMVPNNQWAGFIFWLQDVSTGNQYDYFQVGDPAVAGTANMQVNSSQTGTATGVFSEWFTVTSGSQDLTFFNIYP